MDPVYKEWGHIPLLKFLVSKENIPFFRVVVEVYKEQAVTPVPENKVNGLSFSETKV